MNWFKIEAKKGEEGSYTWVGSSEATLEQLADRASRGDYIVLTDLLYMDRGDVKAWSDWDKSLVPTVAINPTTVFSMMQFNGDPRTTPRK